MEPQIVSPSRAGLGKNRRSGAARWAALLFCIAAMFAAPAHAQFGDASDIIKSTRDNKPAELRQAIINGENPSIRDADGTPALVLGADKGYDLCVHLLLDGGARSGDRDKKGETALTAATRRNSLAVVEVLLLYKADPDLPGARGETPLMIAVEGGYAPIVSALIKAGADVNAGDYTGRTPLSVAKQRRQRSIEEDLRKAGAVE